MCQLLSDGGFLLGMRAHVSAVRERIPVLESEPLSLLITQFHWINNASRSLSVFTNNAFIFDFQHLIQNQAAFYCCHE